MPCNIIAEIIIVIVIINCAYDVMEEWWKAITDAARWGNTEKILTILTRIRSVKQKNRVFLSLLSLNVYSLYNTGYKIVNVFFLTCYKNLIASFFSLFFFYLQYKITTRVHIPYLCRLKSTQKTFHAKHNIR